MSQAQQHEQHAAFSEQLGAGEVTPHPRCSKETSPHVARWVRLDVSNRKAREPLIGPPIRVVTIINGGSEFRRPEPPRRSLGLASVPKVCTRHRLRVE